MTEPVNVTIGAAGLGEGVREAGAEIDRVAREQIAPAAALIEDAFTGAARAIQFELARAAERGGLSMKSLSRSILTDLRRIAIDSFVRKPVEALVTSLFSGAFGGGRAGGGFVAPGASFLVGERGPEIFTPSASGRVNPVSPARGVTVNITLPGVRDAESFRQSETQIAAALARAVGRGERNL
ncbi:MAG: phage tail tape measure C-terminal domain-containing protein [Parvularculaceae bacterium]